jgi:hypothetical protein
MGKAGPEGATGSHFLLEEGEGKVTIGRAVEAPLFR